MAVCLQGRSFTLTLFASWDFPEDEKVVQKDGGRTFIAIDIDVARRTSRKTSCDVRSLTKQVGFILSPPTKRSANPNPEVTSSTGLPRFLK